MTFDAKSLLHGDIKRSTSFFVKGSLPTLNEYTNATRSHRQASARIKREADAVIGWHILSQIRGWKAEAPVFLVFRWIEKDKRRDHDNVAFAKKFIQDAMVKAGVLEGDGWKHVVGFLDLFAVDKENPGVEVIILEVGDEQ